jgi:hypothetical protein
VTIPRSILRRVVLPLAAYALLEWLFAYVTVAEGLVTPHGKPNLDVVAIGCAYLGVRIIVRVLVPGLAAFTIADAIAQRLRPTRMLGG